MKPILSDWNGPVTVNGQDYTTVAEVDFKGLKGQFHILLKPQDIKPDIPQVKQDVTPISEIQKTGEIKIRVKPYMTKPAVPEFDFMLKWNDNKPMPMVEMAGVKVKETRGMIYMELHGLAEPVIVCRRCGKTLTNPISRKYGIGPECMSKLGFTYDINDVEDISKALVDVKWEGWIIKSAILEEQEI